MLMARDGRAETMPMFLISVTHRNTEARYFMRNTVWTSDGLRATQFPTREAAQAHFDKWIAGPFTKPRVFKQTYSPIEIIDA
jgi:hypothetical protein